MNPVRSWDAIIIGGGIVGLTLALELRKHHARVLVIDRHEPAHEATHASAGMLAALDPDTPEKLRILALASAAMYTEFVREVESESGHKLDLRSEGTIAFVTEEETTRIPLSFEFLFDEQLAQLEPALTYRSEQAVLLREQTLDPRALALALVALCKARGVELATGAAVTTINVESGRATGVATAKTTYASNVVINCAGAWASEVSPTRLPVRPIKGQMLCVIAPRTNLIRHVIRTDDIYLVPRTDGRILIGATLEDVGFDKRVDPETIQQMHQMAANLVPEIGQARMHEAWAGLRPCSADDLPILGRTSTDGYFVATAHFRNGILLAPLTARLLTQLIRGEQPEIDIADFALTRFM